MKSTKLDIEQFATAERVSYKINRRAMEKLLAERGITKTQLAAAIRCTPPHVSDMVNGRRYATKETVMKIQTFLGQNDPR